MSTARTNLRWWQTAAIYQVYPRSFQDTDGDGVGDLPGVIRRLDHLCDLGVDAVWINPFFRSPMKDFGYDVSDYCDVDPTFGTLADFDRLLAEAHRRGLRVLLDLVPNHTSDRHPWFVESHADRGSPKRDWYVWRDPAPGGGPPNNWISFFGGPAWTLDRRTGQYYLHHFLPEQPDLNYRNPEVVEAMLDVMRFWLDRGADGFRVDVLWMLVEDPHFRDEPDNPAWRPGMRPRDRLIHCYTDDQLETHEIVRRMRALLDAYGEPERIMVGEIYLPYPKLVRYYGTPQTPECHLPYNFGLVERALGDWRPEVVRAVVEDYEAHLPPWAWPNWVLGNHDRPRVAARIGSEQARVATMLLCTLRGTPTIYYGDEIAMTGTEVPPDRVRDLPGLRDPLAHPPRDPARTPMQWDDSPYAGFSVVEPWLPVHPDYRTRNVAAQRDDPRSMLNLTRRLLRLRRESVAFLEGTYRSVTAPQGVFAFVRAADRQRWLVALNLTGAGRRLEGEGGEVVLSTHMDREGRERNALELRPHEGVVVRIA
ncbi:MAG: alpha-amylase family glycosyl hydrolase [Armatimonadota bacterium]|nr:alpha-amylase family glycosyl hydrolase [Armatimonadota bacterium]MDR5697737.1 alpha-amylase family glycosyl hydrolase [Armatimonadota bacterium]